MTTDRSWRHILFSDLGILILIALAKLLFHTLTNGQYGWHRDELAMLDDARYLAWGYVAYPPLTPALTRLGLALFGPSLAGVRFFAALAQSAMMVLAGLIARELGASRTWQVVAALAVAGSPASLAESALIQYVAFDLLWWVLAAYFVVRLLKSENPRWWLGIGAVIGLGMMTKYTMAYFAVGIVGAVLLTKNRRYLASPWLWAGVALSLLIFLPNLIWQIRHDFISLDFLSDIHARDIRIGRTQGYLTEQLYLTAGPFALPLWVAGLYAYFFGVFHDRYRMLGWMYVIPFGLFLATQGRGYYLSPAYPMLVAAGAAAGNRWVKSLAAGWARLAQGAAWAMVGLGLVIDGLLMLPLAPINSGLWDVTNEVHDLFREEIGWPELTETVADIYASLPEAEQAQTGILAGNYGEAGAINLYGPAYGLPEAISGINSYWYRGYGPGNGPQTAIVVGFQRIDALRIFETCELAGEITNRYGVLNEETQYHRNIFLCRTLRRPWPELWPEMRWYG
jgi:4-amino-4-deoxy-L-arabinose transferase-like glycosyltransferase